MKSPYFPFASTGILWLLLFTSFACTPQWTKVIKKGSLYPTTFEEKIDVEVKLGLIIVPVTIEGITYRFLLDTGAPFSISEDLQAKLDYKIISKGHIVDSDNNRKAIHYVSVDSISIGSVVFIQQTAFVGDFTSNPIIKCLELDGIVGSNLMRHCNWVIDYQREAVTLSKLSNPASDATILPFHTDAQYNILTNVNINGSTIHNLTIDYGSNGTLSLPENAYQILVTRNKIKTGFVEKGVKQSGMIGQAVPVEINIAYVDSVQLGSLVIKEVEIRSGSSGLIGQKVLSRYIVTIDWDEQQLYLKENISKPDNYRTYGFKPGTYDNGELYIQSVTEHSSAWEQGIRPNMQVLQINTLDFQHQHDYCDYIDFLDEDVKEISVTLLEETGDTLRVTVEKQSLQ